MAKIVIRPGAESDLDAIYAYLTRNSQMAAERFLNAVQIAFENLILMPELGGRSESRQGPGRFTSMAYPWLSQVSNLLSIIPEGIEIRRVIHGARDIENLFE